jgi:hypothetical protein
MNTHMNRLTSIIIAAIITFSCVRNHNLEWDTFCAEQLQSLSGEWQFRVDSVKELAKIKLPGSCEEQVFGAKSTV